MIYLDKIFEFSLKSEYEEIVRLRTNGQYNEAYEKAINVKANNPDCLWVYNQLGWCLRDRMKNATSPECHGVFLTSLQEIADINKEHPLDAYIIKAVVWPIREYVAKCITPTLRSDLLHKVFAIMQQIAFDTNDDNYHVLLQPFLKAKEWEGLGSVIDWWGIDNLKPSDYVPYTMGDGKKIMSFAEQLLIAYSRILLKSLGENRIQPEEARPHVQRLEQAASTYPDLQYPRYFQAQLMLAMGDSDGVVDTLLPFVRQKRNDYWVWELLGDAVSDKDMRIACYCKALSCPVKDSFLRKLYFKTCDAFMVDEKYPVAKAMLRKGIEVSRVNSWSIPYKYQNYLQEEWYLQAIEIDLDRKFYSDYVSIAEQMLYSEKPQRVVLVTFVNKEKQVMNFLTVDRESGFVRYRNLIKKPREGMLLRCKMEQIDGKWRIYSASEEMDTAAYEGKLILNTMGNMRKTAKGLGFVGDVFVPEHLASELKDGQSAKCIAILNYNKVKQQWGWKAISVSSI